MDLRIPQRLDPQSVTTTAVEADPVSVGLAPGAVHALWSGVEDLYRSGAHPAIALCVRRGGQVILDRAVGHASGNAPDDLPGTPLVPATPSTPFCIFSASKAVTAMLVHHLDDRGLLHVGDRVAEYLPEFARHGKEWVTVRHVLSHRAGLPSLGGREEVDLLLRPREVLQRLCDAKPSSRAGRRLAYHAITGGFLLGEIVERVTGKGLREVLREEFLAPLGFEGMNYGWPAERVGEVARNAFTGRRGGPVLDLVARRALGVTFEEAAAISNSPTWFEAVVPSGNVVATANEACRFFELLLREGTLDGVRVFAPRTLRRAVTETAHLELDFTTWLPIRYGEGLMLGANWISLFGPDTPRAFGHLGLSNIFCWADPDRDLSVALLTSGKPLFSSHLIPLVRLLRTFSRVCRRL